MTQFERIGQLCIGEGARQRILDNVAREIENQGGKSWTWGRVMRSRPFKVGVSFTVAAAMILSVALPVTLSSHADLNGPISGGVGFGGASETQRHPFAWSFAYRIDHSCWARGDIPVTVDSYFDLEYFLAYFDTVTGLYAADDVAGDMTDIQLYFCVAQTSEEDLFDYLQSSSADWENAYSGDVATQIARRACYRFGKYQTQWEQIAHGSAAAGETVGHVYVYDAIRVQSAEALCAAYADRGVQSGGRYRSTVQCVIPQELLIGEEGYLVFDVAGTVTYETGYDDTVRGENFYGNPLFHYEVKGDTVCLRSV